MKRTLQKVLASGFLLFAISIGLSAQTRYKIVPLQNLGGTAGAGASINNRGWATGNSNLGGDEVTHAELWLNGTAFNPPNGLGTLGGPNSAVAWPVKNVTGMISGISETAEINPLGERFSCPSFFGTPRTGHSCQGFRWEDGVMTALPTLGGFNSYATGANNLGEIVGWAENTVHDPSCVPPRQVLQFRAVMWDRNNNPHELPPLPGKGSTSAATAINDVGQAVGISGTCFVAVGSFSAAHAVIWVDGVPSEIPNFGGVAWNTPTAINNQGLVAGFSDFPGDGSGAPNFHAFLWTGSGPLIDLKTLGSDPFSAAFGLNEKGQVVGQSLDADFNSRAFLWQNGQIIDLNALALDGSPFLVFANDINDRGEIAGQACFPDQCAAGITFAFIGVPVPGAPANASKDRVMFHERIRNQSRRQLGLDIAGDKQ